MVWRDFLLYWVCKELNVRLLASARRGGRRATAFNGVTQERMFLGLGEGFRLRWKVVGRFRFRWSDGEYSRRTENINIKISY